MAKIDPNDEQYKKKGMEAVGSCTGDFMALGFEHFEINGKKVVEVRSVCLASQPGGEEGRELRDLFFLHSPGALTRFVSFAKDGCGWNQPFDPEDPRDVAKIISNRPFRAKVQAKQDGEYTRHECGWSYSAPRIQRDPSDGGYTLSANVVELVTAAKKVWDGYLKWRAENPRGEGGSGGAGGGSRASGGGGGAEPAAGSGATDGFDDVPF